MVIVGCYCVYGLYQWIASGSSYLTGDTQYTLVAIYLFTLGSAALFAMAFLWSSVFAIAALAVLTLFNWTMRGGLTPTFASGFAGGIAGFFFTWMIWEQLEPNDFHPILLTCIGPGLATVMGQFGGARAAQLRDPLLSSNWNAPEEMAGEQANSRHQFSLRQIFVFTAWLCVLLSLMRLFGEIRPRVLGLIAVWFVYQAITLTFILRWLLPWWDRIRRRRHREAFEPEGSFT